MSMDREEMLAKALKHYDETIDQAKADAALSATGCEKIINDCLVAKSAVQSFVAALRASAAPSDGGLDDLEDFHEEIRGAVLEAAAVIRKDDAVGVAHKILATGARRAAAAALPSPDAGDDLNHRTTAEPDLGSGHRSAEDASLEQRLRDKANDLYNWHGETMKRWDEIRHQCAKRDGSDLPRLMFEQIIEDHADLMIEAADALLGTSSTVSDQSPRRGMR